jgi:hypothetical protein
MLLKSSYSDNIAIRVDDSVPLCHAGTTGTLVGNIWGFLGICHGQSESHRQDERADSATVARHEGGVRPSQHFTLRAHDISTTKSHDFPFRCLVMHLA